LLVSAIICDIDHYLDGSGNFTVTEEQMNTLLDYALTCGRIDEASSIQPMPVMFQPSNDDGYIRKKYAMYPVRGVITTSFCDIETLGPDASLYVGVPTLDGAARMIDSLNMIEENDYALMQIIIEECMPALTGQKTASETAGILSSRINIYLQSR
jgi:hypothetical protein